jgi:hypothetical protein
VKAGDGTIRPARPGSRRSDRPHRQMVPSGPC